MLRDVVSAMESGPLAEVGLVAFCVAFLLIVVRAFALPERDRHRAKNLPFDADPAGASPREASHAH